MQDLASFYRHFAQNVGQAQRSLHKPLTLAEKILIHHLGSNMNGRLGERGFDYAMFRPDRVAMQDATAQMAILQFMNAQREVTAVPTSIHCDHLVRADQGDVTDLSHALKENREVYDFLASAAKHYGMDFWAPGAGIIHQVILENYAFPGGMMVGTDSHTPNAGGLGMLAIGVGGADAVDVMAGLDWELKVPRLIGVKLTGRLPEWCAPKDVILKLAGLLTVKGGTHAIIEYFGEGAATLSCSGKACICNMGAEVGATCSVFPFDDKMAEFLKATHRRNVAEEALRHRNLLQADAEVQAHPERYYDQVVHIDLSTLSPHVNGPFTPDAACPVGNMAERVTKMDFPDAIDVVLIGSCTNSSYQDLALAASVARTALKAGKKPRTELVICPGSESIRATAERDGLMDVFRQCGALIMANACGPCIGQWKRHTDHPDRKNTIVTTFNRNFAKRADGNPHTHAFITSPELAMGYAFTGFLSKNPTLLWPAPTAPELPMHGFAGKAPQAAGGMKADPSVEIRIPDHSNRLQRLAPFAPFHSNDFVELPLLIKVKGKCTTDHISMAGSWLQFRGHLENISRNLLMGAVNAFNDASNSVRNPYTGQMMSVSESASLCLAQGHGSFVVAEENYGEGSSREHAAMEPRFLGVRMILAKSFARIHETNLKKQGVLALTFACGNDYERVLEGDCATLADVAEMRPGKPLHLWLKHANGSTETLVLNHSYNALQIEWLKAGSALNFHARHKE